MSHSQVQQQIAAIPSLQHLKLATSETDVVKIFSPFVIDLTWMHEEDEWVLGQDMLGFKFPKLERLNSHNLVITETGMRVLSGCMPKLQQVDIESFNLSAAIAASSGTSCLTRVGMWGVLTWENLKSLYYALQSVQVSELYARGDDVWVRLWDCGDSKDNADSDNEDSADSDSEHNADRDSVVSAVSDTQMATRVALAVQQTGGLKLEGDRPTKAVFFINKGQPQHVQQVMHSLMPMFHNLHSLSLQGSIQVDSTLLGIVGSLPNCQELELLDDQDVDGWEDLEQTKCSFEADLWEGKLMSLLPNVRVLRISCDQVRAGALLMLCDTAPRPIKVCVDARGWWDDDEVLMRAVQVIAKRNGVEVEHM